MQDMRELVLPGVAVLLLLAGLLNSWLNHDDAQPAKDAQPDPAAEAAVIRPPSHHYAPEGRFFILKYVSAVTSKGPVGFEPGREVEFVRALPETETLLVTDGKYELEVSPRVLTNDLEIADLARRQDEASQFQVAMYQERESRAFYVQRMKAEMDAAERVHAADARRIQAGVIGNWDKALNHPARPASSYYGYAGSIWQGSPYSYFY